MKKQAFIALGAAFILGVITISSALSQINNNNPNVSGELGKPASVPMLKILANRFHSFEIERKAYNIQASGLSEMSYVAAFTAKGAILYNHELTGSNPRIAAGKNVGAQILPYTVTVTTDNRIFISVAGFSLRNMISAKNGKASSIFLGTKYYSPFDVIDNLEALVFEYDKNASVDGVKRMELKILSTDLKLDILNSSKPGTFLALTGGASIGMSTTTIGNGIVISGHRENKDQSKRMNAFSASLRYGLKFNTSKSGWRFNGGANLEHVWDNGESDNLDAIREYQKDLDQYDRNFDDYVQALEDHKIAVQNYNADKAAYEIEHLEGADLSQESYFNITGIRKPKAPSEPERVGSAPEREKIRRIAYYLVPSLKISKNIAGKDQMPVRLGVGAYGNFAIQDYTKGFTRVDLSLRNRELVGMKLFLNF